ncbi:response regulator [Salidesulfovibrio onnuriiensis]|uniref:response regulator n=1 Tax=Salidesulfovibrio onnuriiensis TaxID=2583823 RepID=UPI0011CC86B9|nr:response regulator [Salidesulfovibrio onnuriiensis]
MKETEIKILLVDDEKGFTDVMTKRLSRRGMRVTVASGGTEAIQAMRGIDYDVALLDLKMEDMSGIEVLQIFKKMLPEMPVIMLTGHGSEEAAREGMQHGAFDYLLKPCEFDKLLRKIMAAVKSTNKSQ